MLHIRPVLSPYAHARIVSIDGSAARQVPGVVAVLTAQDLPTRDRAINSRHSAVLARERVLFRGQPVVAVVAESEHAAQDGADAVLIDYEPLPAVMDPLEALAADAPVIWPDGVPKEGADMTAAHAAVDKETVEQEGAPSNLHAENHFARGDVEQGFQQADVIDRARLPDAVCAPGLHGALCGGGRAGRHGAEHHHLHQHAGPVHRARRDPRGCWGCPNARCGSCR